MMQSHKNNWRNHMTLGFKHFYGSDKRVKTIRDDLDFEIVLKYKNLYFITVIDNTLNLYIATERFLLDLMF